MADWRACSNITKIEEEFAYFYSCVMLEIQRRNWNRKRIEKCNEALTLISRLRTTMNHVVKKRCYTFINFLTSSIRFAYVYAFSIINTCTSYQHFFNLFNANEDLQRIMKSKRSIRICCLGGGPGVEAIAICKIINDFFKAMFPNSCGTKNANDNRASQVLVHVTIVDIFVGWKQEAFAIMNSAMESSIVDSELVTIETSFIQADLLQGFIIELQEELKNADIVTMVRLGSDIVDRMPEGLCTLCNNLCELAQLLKLDSCLFIQDTADGPLFHHLKNVVCRTTLTNIASYEDRDYCLNPENLPPFETLGPIDLVRDENVPVRTSKVSSCIWMKTKSFKEGRNALEESINYIH